VRQALSLLAAAIAFSPALAVAQSVAAAPPQASAESFHAILDKAFGPGGWRETSGYRSEAREDELRREGAGTVPAGQISRHSMGTEAAPGAYDVVVPGMSFATAAARLRGSEGINRVVAERAHGREGPHLHIEPAAYGHGGGLAEPARSSGDDVYLRVVNGHRNPLLSRAAHRVIIVE